MRRSTPFLVPFLTIIALAGCAAQWRRRAIDSTRRRRYDLRTGVREAGPEAGRPAAVCPEP